MLAPALGPASTTELHATTLHVLPSAESLSPPSYSTSASSTFPSSPSIETYTPHPLTSLPSRSTSSEPLPMYEEQTSTEPKTLARSLFRWGFLCPLFWLLGSLILCSPLTPLEEEDDPTKQQKVNEMIAILRQAELRHARRCAIAFASFLVMIVMILVVILVSLRYAR